ncbi:MAG: DUF151 domain-containing protein [Thermomicrobiales bacterium]|nr:DUF151 domain-containing protein [Thermomicrobiales bacterium]
MSDVRLTIHGLAWCAQHGHPLLGLCARSERVIWISITPDDAQALSPTACDCASGRSRIYKLLEDSLAASGSTVRETSLMLGLHGELEASIVLDGPVGDLRIPAHPADAIVLACRSRRAITISESDLETVCPELSDTGRATVEDACESTPDPFRAFIESLDLGAIDGTSPL